MTESAELADDRIVATYDLHDTERSPDALAAAIALEQTVEVPQALADTAGLPPGVVGEIERIDIGAGAEGAARAMLSYDPAVVEAGGVPALINLVFGNVSMMPLHSHIVIGARDRGVLVLGTRRETLSPMDVACIGPLEVHQLRNESSEPFGFFCIVDHDRDRPMAP